MPIHPFQVSDLNQLFLATAPVSRQGGSFASEFGILPDNINGNTSRYLHLQGMWANISVGSVIGSPNADSYGQGTGSSDSNGNSQPWRPNGSYFVRGLYFTNTAVPPAGTGFRDGYIGSFVGGLVEADYSHDPNGSTVDYEPVYGHGVAIWPMTADIAHQWLDSSSSPSDGTDSILNVSSVLSRTIYMPASYQIFHIDSTGSQQTGSGSMKFHIENRPSLRMAGFFDNNGSSGVSPSWAGTSIPSGFGATYPYGSDPLRQSGSLTSSQTDNFHELYQVTGVRKLNSRGLSFHTAKVFDNGFNAYAYPYEEDGITLGTGVTVSGSQIQGPQWTQVNNQTEYTWAGGRDKGTSVISTSVTSNVVTIICNNSFSAGQIVLVQGLTSGNGIGLNGSLLTVSGTGLSSTQFEAAFTHSNYGTTNETSGGTVVFNPDFRVRNAAVFIINEEYYGLVMDTKCTIWSNKSSMIPLLFVDLADIWTGSTAKRIAGTAVVPTNINATSTLAWQVFFLAEDGKLARYDFTQTNGVLELAGSGSFSFATSAPAVVSVGESYGALKTRFTTSPITATSITSNVLTVTCVNTFEAGEVVNLSGTAEAFLNGQTVTVLASGLSGTQFEANFTHANFTNGADTGSAVGYSLWALYGTMTGDPRTTQSALVNTARIGVVRYLVGSGAWGSVTFSPNTGRHNGRSLQEMFSPRDNKLYILCEDVTVTGSGPFGVSNAFGAVTNVNWQVMAYDPVANTWNTSKINGSSPIQYGTNMGPLGVTPNQGADFWFYNINAFMHDVGVGSVLVQGNWTAGAIWILDVSGSTAALSNSNITSVASSTLLPNDAFIPSQTNPATDPVSIVHARDYATNADRTVFFPHNPIRSNNTTVPIYIAPPSFNWTAPSALALTLRNSYAGNPAFITSVDKDKWSYSMLDSLGGSFDDHYAFLFPTMLVDNYVHFLRCSGSQDGLPINTTYGRNIGQSMGFLPTYWKWTGSAWVMADNWTDAFNNPYTIAGYAGGYSSTIALPYGLAAQFGPLSTTSWTQGEFHTWNMCYGNTKFARKLRSSWAQFAGQTFTNTETRTVATQEAVIPYLIDTDPGTATWTAPTSVTPNTASLTTNYLGWTTAAAWNKLDVASAGFDATPVQLVWTPNGFTSGSYANPPANSGNVTGSNPYSWTVGAHTYVSTSSSEQGGQQSWLAFENQPNDFWAGGGGLPAWVGIDLGLGNAQTVLSYGFRSVYSGSDTVSSTIPTSWTLQGSNDGTYTDNSGGPFILDTRSSIPTSRGYAYNVGTPSSYRYYRIFVTVTSGSAFPQISDFRLSTAVLQTTCNFVDLVLYSYGSQVASSYLYRWLQNRQLSRGYLFEVSTNNGGSYTPITPIWRAHNGYVFTFARQTGVTNIRITVQHGYNISNTQTGFGPFYLIDYGVSQATLDAARLGVVGAPVGTSGAASFDPNCLGIATDVPNISIDGGNPSLLTAYSTFENGAVHGFWDWNVVPSAGFKIHPFFGFMQFQQGGQDGGVSTQTGTSIAINYQWGRRI